MTADERAGLAEASWALYGRGAVTVVVEGLLASGARSRIWRLVALGPGGTRQYAVKWLRPDDANTADSAARSYDALVKLTQAVSTIQTEAYVVRCPAPVQAWNWGYLMTAVPGRSLDDALVRRQLPGGEQPPLARDLVTALIAFHTAHNRPHGDFHPGNVLLGANRDVYLLGPASGSRLPLSWPPPPVPPHLAVDIAFWAFRTATRALRQSARHPGAAVECARFARVLGQAAVGCTGDPALAGHIEQCLADHWARFGRQGIQHRVLATVARGYLGDMCLGELPVTAAGRHSAGRWSR